MSPSGPPIENETMYRRAWRNTNAFLDQYYKKEPRYRLCHAPFALRKSFMQKFENEFPHIFAENSLHRFRSDKDFNVTNGLLQYYWLYHDNIVSMPMSNSMVSLRNDALLKVTIEKLQQILDTRPSSFCLQDVMDTNSSLTKALVHNFLEKYFPDAAPWENNLQ